MAVAAAVVADSDLATTRAGIHMPTQICCPAPFDGRKCAQLPAIDMVGAFHLWPMRLQHIGYLKSRLHDSLLFCLRWI